jgi:transaldolase/glucose-6-phosphate isomerase
MVQRVLWASTGTKNPAYSDVLYLDNLIGKDTVNTVPPDTLAAFRDHGQPKLTLETGLDEAKATLSNLAAAGISLDKATDELLVDAIKKFVEPFTKLLQAVDRRVGEAKAR